ncbi:MAG: UDP-N-acetylmuramoyl-L-alanyl-D-glutamate--2,6-diaminopimelate ligase [Candidatus Omnitrophota bacterium]
MRSLKALVQEALPDRSPGKALPEISIKGLECDSRGVGKDFLFVAIRGVKKDGTEFIEEAIRRGAAAVVTDRPLPSSMEIPFILVPECRLAIAQLATAFYGHPARKLKTVGITGTNGKTTSSFLIEHFLLKERKETGVIGTVNTRFAGREIPAVETTPGPLRIQQILSQMVDARCDHAVMEVSSHALDQNRVGGIDFEATLFTNLTQDHLDYHKTLEAYFECKAKLFLGLSREKTAVINSDDPWGVKLMSQVPSKILTYGIHADADLRAEQIAWKEGRTFFNLRWRGSAFAVESPLIGTHNVYNVLGALGVMAGLGFDVRKCAGELKHFKGVPGRLESVDEGQNFLVFVDYAHTPDGLENVLKSLAPYKKDKLIAVFGCGGDRDRGKRPQMARIASEFCDQVFVTSDNPRSEDPKAIAQEVCAGFPAHFKDFTVAVDRRKAIRQALLSAREGDIVLLAGKGHETTQIVGDRTLAFSDREEARKVLRGH